MNLTEDVQAHIEWLEANWIAWGNPAVRALIAAVQAGAVREERLRAAVVAYQRVAEQAKPRLLGDDPDASIGVAYEFTTAQDNDLIEAEAMMKAALADTPASDVVVVPQAELERLKAMEARALHVQAEPPLMNGRAVMNYILHGDKEATDAG